MRGDSRSGGQDNPARAMMRLIVRKPGNGEYPSVSNSARIWAAPIWL
jgi:hypothetical protein